MDICWWSYCSSPCWKFLFWGEDCVRRLRMTWRSLEKTPHLHKVSRIMVRHSCLFGCKCEAAETRGKSLRPLWWTIKRGHESQSQRSQSIPLMIVCVCLALLFFSLTVIFPRISAPPLSISLTSFRFAPWHGDPHRSMLNTNEPAICL